MRRALSWSPGSFTLQKERCGDHTGLSDCPVAQRGVDTGGEPRPEQGPSQALGKQHVKQQGGRKRDVLTSAGGRGDAR